MEFMSLFKVMARISYFGISVGLVVSLLSVAQTGRINGPQR